MTDPKTLLARAAAILYGPFWHKRDMSDYLNVNERRFRRMLQGKEDVPPGILSELEIGLRDHGHALDALLNDFDQSSG